VHAGETGGPTLTRHDGGFVQRVSSRRPPLLAPRQEAPEVRPLARRGRAVGWEQSNSSELSAVTQREVLVTHIDGSGTGQEAKVVRESPLSCQVSGGERTTLEPSHQGGDCHPLDYDHAPRLTKDSTFSSRTCREHGRSSARPPNICPVGDRPKECSCAIGVGVVTARNRPRRRSRLSTIPNGFGATGRQ